MLFLHLPHQNKLTLKFPSFWSPRFVKMIKCSIRRCSTSQPYQNEKIRNSPQDEGFPPNLPTSNRSAQSL
jgi:hypothetical protein